MDEKQHVVYMLRCADDSLYTGYTNHLSHRLKMHTAGKGAKYTRGRGPFELVYVETFPTKGEALSREISIKKLKRRQKLHLIETSEKGKWRDAFTKEL